ncbi:chromate efflux transporter [Corynebacterium doosanense]|uniref:Chromate transporter n=1 Tax=Corynebacterium doosanense CAU 212 = DSM 45436 TaxID=558173 RepID=A0A097IHT7_9CORY|nr:chromate efflux transporter [Corynebacterium doosanense]AIT61690.1 chromate transporter [Corynebacterium doosanense CAU 212 = DSM 45436]
MPRPSAVLDVLRSFGALGLTSFGGPAAHLGYFRTAFVERRTWLSDHAFADLVAVSQFLPGAGSSKVGMGLGYHRGGWAGMALAWIFFTLPSALVLGAFGLFVTGTGIDPESGWIRGLLAVAVGVVFHAVSGMARSLASTPVTATIAVASALAVLLVAHSAIQVTVIVAAGVLGMLLLRTQTKVTEPSPETLRPVPRWAGYGAVALYFALLAGLWAGARFVGGPVLTRAYAYYETGALVFGGGHVVLPLLQAHAVGGQWMSEAEFLAGYSVAQAVPGPLFTFATYLGAVDGGISGAVLATVMIFLPSALLIVAGMYFWSRWRHYPLLRAAFAGINAAVVGLLLAALYDPVFTHGITGPRSLAVAAIAWLMLAVWKLPPWSVAAFGALAGWLLLSLRG